MFQVEMSRGVQSSLVKIQLINLKKRKEMFFERKLQFHNESTIAMYLEVFCCLLKLPSSKSAPHLIRSGRGLIRAHVKLITSKSQPRNHTVESDSFPSRSKIVFKVHPNRLWIIVVYVTSDQLNFPQILFI